MRLSSLEESHESYTDAAVNVSNNSMKTAALEVKKII